MRRAAAPATLPFTGSATDTVALGGLGLLLLLLGAVVQLAGRRRYVGRHAAA